MSNVQISKSSNYIKYTSDSLTWEADIYFNIPDREIQILGTTRALSDKERDDIITKILGKYVFGNYLNSETDIFKCKLKNRNQEKYNERKEDKMSYSIIGEKVLEYKVNSQDLPFIVVLKSIYTNLKIETLDMKEKNKNMTTLEFKFLGTKSEYKLCLKILEYIIKEIENELSICTNLNLTLNFVNSKYNIKEKNAKILFIVKEA